MMWCGKCYIVNFPPEPEPPEESRDHFTEDLNKALSANQRANAEPAKQSGRSDCKPCFYQHGGACTVSPMTLAPGGGYHHPPAVYRCMQFVTVENMASRVADRSALEQDHSDSINPPSSQPITGEPEPSPNAAQRMAMPLVGVQAQDEATEILETFRDTYNEASQPQDVSEPDPDPVYDAEGIWTGKTEPRRPFVKPLTCTMCVWNDNGHCTVAPQTWTGTRWQYPPAKKACGQYRGKAWGVGIRLRELDARQTGQANQPAPFLLPIVQGV